MKYAAELLGTFVLVFAGLTTAVIAGGQVHNVGVAMAFGLSLLAMAYTLGPISGCHINPAVTLGMLVARRITFPVSIGYWISQAIGGILASGVVLFLSTHYQSLPGQTYASLIDAANGYASHSPGGYAMGACFVAEMFLTMLLVLTVLGATDDRAPAGFAGIPIGLILTVIILAGIPITNGSFNPARSIGPAVWVGSWAIEQLWLFIVAPMLGGLLAALLYLGVRVPGPMIKTRQALQALPSERVERRETK
jgi:aquaporin Z